MKIRWPHPIGVDAAYEYIETKQWAKQRRAENRFLYGFMLGGILVPLLVIMLMVGMGLLGVGG
jgi:hypothetical protein